MLIMEEPRVDPGEGPAAAVSVKEYPVKERVVIVDGYNVIRNEERYEQVSHEALELARTGLAEALVSFAGLTGTRVILVFDGSGRAGGTERSTQIGGLEVWFSGSGRSADDLIERTAFELRQGQEDHEIRVVTGDYALQNTVFGDEVFCQSPVEFMKEVDDVRGSFEGKQGRREQTIEGRIDKSVVEALEHLFSED